MPIAMGGGALYVGYFYVQLTYYVQLNQMTHKRHVSLLNGNG